MDSSKRNVFVVHGRNLRARNAVFDFLRSLGLNPLEWEEVVARTGKGSPIIRETVTDGIHGSDAAVVILTPDEQARLRLDNSNSAAVTERPAWGYQPRPNVLVELGMALGAFGPSTILLELGAPFRAITDIDGSLVVRWSPEDERGFRNSFRNRLKTIGLHVSDYGTEWLEAGDFKSAAAAHSDPPDWELLKGYDRVFDRAADLFDSAQSRIGDLSWGAEGDLIVTDTIKQARKRYREARARAITRGVLFQEVVTLPTTDRFKALEKRGFHEMDRSYQLKWYDFDHRLPKGPPLMAYLVVDDRALLIGSFSDPVFENSQNDLPVYSTHPDVVQVFSNYFKAIWHGAEVVKNQDGLRQEVVERMRKQAEDNEHLPRRI